MSRDLSEQMAHELEALAERQPITTIELPTYDAWMLIGVLQLVLRHPGFHGGPRDVAERLKNGLVGRLATSPALAAVATMGDDPRFDS